MSPPSKSKGIPEDVLKLMSAMEKKHGFREGTMLSLMRQEIGGNTDKYLQDPTTYHYAPNAEGKRVAPHTGKISTAFGPFGILESTGKDPGYGVQPLADKSIAEQIRFAGDYLAARSKAAGSFTKGLAGYGEGTGYANQVVARMEGSPVPRAAAAPGLVPLPPVGRSRPAPVLADVPGVPQEVLAQASPSPVQKVAPEVGPGNTGPVPLPPELVSYLAQRSKPPVMPVAENAWNNFLNSMRKPVNPAPVAPADVDYGGALPVMVRAPVLAPAMPVGRVDFSAFGGFNRKLA